MHLEEADWRARMAAHEQRVDPLVVAHLQRRSRGQVHPVEDFLFVYYPFRAAHLHRWHPGIGVTLGGDPPHAGWTGYRRSGAVTTLDPSVLDKRLPTVRWVADLLRATASRPAFTGCFGLHEWAMVYRTGPGEVRHDALRLRLGHAGTDAVVEGHQIRCTHFDAF
ncbi:MAG: 3-methyladenine DNA glycosylase, partial [Jiangellaceae bacterium]